jgi:hypothetical protein
MSTKSFGAQMPRAIGSSPSMVGVSLGLAALIATSVGALSAIPDPVLRTDAAVAPEGPPLAFVPNAGQSGPRVRFRLHAAGATIFFMPRGIVASRQTSDASISATRLRFRGADRDAELLPVGRLPGVVNYLVGEPREWREAVPTYGAIVYRDLYPGIDLRYDEESRPEALGLSGRYEVAPGGDPGDIRWRYEDARSARVEPLTGSLRVQFRGPGGPLIEPAPAAWQAIDGRRVPVPARYRVTAGGAVGVELGNYDARHPVAITAAIDDRAAGRTAASYSTYLGGTQWDEGLDVDTDRSGNAFIAGFTVSADFPMAKAMRSTFAGVVDAFVTKISSDGDRLLYSTYLGGGDVDAANSIDVDDAGNAYVVGRTGSPDFPTAHPLQPALRGRACQGRPCHDAFAAKLDPGGGRLLYSTYLGGRRNDEALGIAVDDGGRAHITGNTDSTDYPTRDALLPAFGGPPCLNDLPCPLDAFVTKLDRRGGALVYSTYLGGSESDTSGGIAVDPGGNAYVTGSTRSPDFPTTGALQPELRGRSCGPPPAPCRDLYVAKFNPGGEPVYSTFLGGTETESSGGIAVDAGGSAFVTGSTQSTDFPTVDAIDSAADNGSCSDAVPKELCNDVFVTKLSPDGGALRYSTYLSGSAEDQGLGIAVDDAGTAYITGSTDSGDFRTERAVQETIGGYIDAFVATIDPGGGAVVFSSFLGGSDAERGNSIAVDEAGNAYVTGRTDSPDFPTVKALQRTIAGDLDAFAVKITIGTGS